MQKQCKIREYDEEPVTFCARCYSLKIKYEDSIGIDCCEDCGSSDLQTASIEEWEKLYKGRYGHKYIEDKCNVTKSPLFQMSSSQLKTKVYNHPNWREICQVLYPTFPNWLSKADSVILLFAKLCQDNRLDDLRMELFNRTKNKKNYGRAEESNEC